MSQGLSGWAWFDSDNLDGEPAANDAHGNENLPQLFARTFQGRNGSHVLSHLKAITLERTLGPNAADPMLRHLEGQRQLVSYILSLVEHGSGRPVVGAAHNSAGEASMENDDG